MLTADERAELYVLARVVCNSPLPGTARHDLIAYVESLLAAEREPQEKINARNEIANQLQWWLDYNEKMHAAEGTAVTDDFAIMNNGYTNAPPCWPSRSQLKNWIIAIRAGSERQG